MSHHYQLGLFGMLDQDLRRATGRQIGLDPRAWRDVFGATGGDIEQVLPVRYRLHRAVRTPRTGVPATRPRVRHTRVLS
jgi:hypothetical protein